MSTPTKTKVTGFGLSDKEVNAIIALYKKGISIRTIAKQIHRSDKTVSAIIKAWVAANKGKNGKDCPDCKPCDDCSDYSCKPCAAPAKKPAAKIPAFSVKEIATIRRLRKSGATLKSIAKSIGRSDKSVAAFVKQDCPDCTPSKAPAKCKDTCNEKKCADKAKTNKPAAKPAPKNGVPGVDFVKIPITDEQRKSLIIGFKLLEVADGITRVLAEAFKGL